MSTTVPVYEVYFQDRAPFGYRNFLVMRSGRKWARVLIIGSGEILSLPRAMIERASCEALSIRRARRAVRNIIARRRLCGRDVSAELRAFEKSVGRVPATH